MVFLKKYWLAVVCPCLLIASGQNSSQNMPNCPVEQKQPTCCEETEELLPEIAAYNAPVTYSSCAPTNLYVTGSFVYWQVAGDYLTYAYVNNSFNPNPAAIENFLFDGKSADLDFEYKPGFRVGLGYKTDYDNWDVLVEYTRFHQQVSSSTSVQSANQRLHPLWITFVSAGQIFAEDCRRASAKWKTDFDIIDAEVGRHFYLGQHLTFRPAIGLRTLWLDQSYDVTYVPLTVPGVAKSSNSSESWGIGPKISFDSVWNIYGGFKMLGDCAFSLLSVSDSVKIKQTNSRLPLLGSSTDITYKNKQDINDVKPIIDLSLGLAWGRSVFQDKSYIDFSVKYDFSVYFDQSSIQLGQAGVVTPGGPNQVVVGGSIGGSGNITVQGLEVSARIDF